LEAELTPEGSLTEITILQDGVGTGKELRKREHEIKEHSDYRILNMFTYRSKRKIVMKQFDLLRHMA